jgi:hypothetical protein
MAINNRSLDGSLQRDITSNQLGAVGGAAAETHCVHLAPRPQLVEQIKVAALGVTGSYHNSFQVYRFNSTGGATLIGGLAATLTVVAAGTSGIQTATYAASMVLLANDMVQMIGGASNVGCTDLKVEVVVKNLSDIRTNFGTSY